MLTRYLLLPTIALLAVAVMIIANNADRLDLAVYALSFWHYLIYALAGLWRRIEHDRFVLDSVILKGMSLVAFGLVLWSSQPHLLALIVMIIGFGLNIVAAQALGKARTYYGYELGVSPPKRISTFPYSVSWIRHPMLVGSMIAYAGPLLDGGFRQDWWQLGLFHMLLNFAIILAEAHGHGSRRAGWFCGLGSLVIGAFLLLYGYWEIWPFALATVILCIFFGIVIIRRYA